MASAAPTIPLRPAAASKNARSPLTRWGHAPRGRLTALGAVILLGALLAGTLLAVGSAHRSQDVLQAVNSYQVAVTTERGVTNTRDPFTVPQLRAIQTTAISELKDLRSTAIAGAALAELVRLDDTYQAAVKAEFDALAAGNPALAAHLDEVSADPAFTPLAADLQGVFNDASQTAKLSATIVNVLSIMVAVLTALLSTLFIIISSRRRDRSAAACC